MRSQLDSRPRAEEWTALALCAAPLAAWALAQLVRRRPDGAWLTLAAAGLAAAGMIALSGRPRWLRLQRGLIWGGLLLLVWVANGLPFDLFRVAGLIPLPVDWPGLAIRTLALAAAVAFARLALAGPSAPGSDSARGVRSSPIANWYGYAAFVLALPYPVLRTWWALGGTPGLGWPGAAGEGFAAWLFAIPWLLAAVLSLLLVPTWRRLPRRLLLAAGWFATTFVALIGPTACWTLVSAFAVGRDLSLGGIAAWVPALFYGSWFLWPVAAAAATRSYQLRSAAPRPPTPA